MEEFFPLFMARQAHHKWEGIKGRVKTSPSAMCVGLRSPSAASNPTALFIPSFVGQPTVARPTYAPCALEVRVVIRLYNQAKIAPQISPSTNAQANPMRLPNGLMQ